MNRRALKILEHAAWYIYATRLQCNPEDYLSFDRTAPDAETVDILCNLSSFLKHHDVGVLPMWMRRRLYWAIAGVDFEWQGRDAALIRILERARIENARL